MVLASLQLPLEDAEVLFYPFFLTAQESDRYFTELTETIQWRQDRITLYGRSHLQPRLTAWYGDPGKAYTYSGLTMQPTPWTDALLTLKHKAEAIAEVTFNSVLLNLYRDGVVPFYKG